MWRRERCDLWGSWLPYALRKYKTETLFFCFERLQTLVAAYECSSARLPYLDECCVLVLALSVVLFYQQGWVNTRGTVTVGEYFPRWTTLVT
jgi:hypothetical protein